LGGVSTDARRGLFGTNGKGGGCEMRLEQGNSRSCEERSKKGEMYDLNDLESRGLSKREGGPFAAMTTGGV